jgi:hypothetical protein
VEIRFDDDEIFEGLIENSVQHLWERVFCSGHPNPEATTSAIYVDKASDQELQSSRCQGTSIGIPHSTALSE